MGAPAFYQHLDTQRALQNTPSLKESEAIAKRQRRAIEEEVERLRKGNA